MKLKTNLYTITTSNETAAGVSYGISLNPDCVIYKAHFPQQPVTPGVCIVEIAHELLEEYLQCDLAVKVVKNVKFLSVISPLEVQDITYTFTNIKYEDGGIVKVQASASAGDTVYAKISLVCQK